MMMMMMMMMMMIIMIIIIIYWLDRFVLTFTNWYNGIVHPLYFP